MHGYRLPYLPHSSLPGQHLVRCNSAKALQLGAKYAQELGFQYIVTLNSDAVPKEGFGEGFDLAQYVLPVRLTDATDSGGLFGFRFG